MRARARGRRVGRAPLPWRRVRRIEAQVRTFDALRVTASVGLAVSTPDTVASELIARADDALYQAKREGKNRLEIFAPAPGGELREND